MLKLGTFIAWCIGHNYGDILFWSLLVTLAGFLIWLAEIDPTTPNADDI